MTGVLLRSCAFSLRHFQEDFLTVQINYVGEGEADVSKPPFAFSRALSRSLCYLAPGRVQ